MPDRTPTSEKLARALEKAGAPSEMIAAARAFYYDEWRSPLIFPIMQLVEDARAAKLVGIVLSAMNGEFDGQDWESRAWAESQEGKETFAALMKPTTPRGPRKPYKRKRANL